MDRESFNYFKGCAIRHKDFKFLLSIFLAGPKGPALYIEYVTDLLNHSEENCDSWCSECGTENLRSRPNYKTILVDFKKNALNSLVLLGFLGLISIFWLGEL